MNKYKNILLVVLVLIVVVIGGCTLKDRIIKKETPIQEPNNPLQLFLKFDASSIEDLSDYHNTITKQGNLSFIDNYNKFDGESSFVEISNDFNKNKDLTIGFWIKPVNRKNGFVLANGPVQNVPSLSILFDSFKRLKFNRGRSPEHSSQNSIPYNQWTHVFITNDGSKTIFYINGVKENEFAQETVVDMNHTKTYIGKGFECSSIYGSFRCSDLFFDGYLDEVRIYNSILSPEETSRLYQETKKL